MDRSDLDSIDKDSYTLDLTLDSEWNPSDRSINPSESAFLHSL